jgi:hypothetical protein
MLKLNDVTLISVSGIKSQETLDSMLYSCRGIEFADVVLVTPEKLENVPNFVHIHPCRPLDYMGYNEYVFSELWKDVSTEFCLLVQNDSKVVRPWLWNDNWRRFDYGAAPWPIRENSYIANDGVRMRVGNGGFALRSQKLMRTPMEKGMFLKEEQGFWHEDGNICCYWHKEMVDAGIKYMDLDSAIRFSFETLMPENRGIPSFGQHKYFQLCQGESVENFR